MREKMTGMITMIWGCVGCSSVKGYKWAIDVMEGGGVSFLWQRTCCVYSPLIVFSLVFEIAAVSLMYGWKKMIFFVERI